MHSNSETAPRRRQWLGYFSLALVVAVACCCLGAWQFARRAEAVTANQRIELNYDAAPVPLSRVLSSHSAFDDDETWQPVEVQGTYVAEDQLLARNRPRSGSPGFEVVTPLRLEDGTIFFVDRGWIPTGSRGDGPDAIPAPPSGVVTVIARLKPSEPSIVGRSGTGQYVPTIKLDDMAAQLGKTAYVGAYGLVVSESPAAREAPLPALKPLLDEGPHLSYALQWYVFAVLALGAFLYIYIRERKMAGSKKASEVPSRRPVRRRTPDDAAVEDDILDSLSSHRR